MHTRRKIYLTTSNLPVDSHDDLTLGLVRFHELMSLDNLLPIHNLLDIGLESAILELGQSVLDKLISELALVLLISCSQSRTLQSDSLEQESTHIRLGGQFHTRQRSKRNNMRIPGRSLQITSKETSTHEIDNNIHALAIRSLEHFLGPILSFGIESGGGTQLFDDEFVLFI